MTRVGDSDQRANALVAMEIARNLCVQNESLTRRSGVSRMQSLLQLIKNTPKNQPFSLYYAVQKRLHKKSEDATTRLRFTQSLYMNSFVQARISVIYHINGSRGLFECV